MAAQLMDGSRLAREIMSRSASRAAELEAGTGIQPCLATVIVGDDPASVTYVRMKENRCRQAGISSRHVALPAQATTAGLVATITGLSADPGVHGILLQHPVPAQIDERAAFEAIDPAKDVDGVTMHSFAGDGVRLPGLRLGHARRDHAAAGCLPRRPERAARRGAGPKPHPRQAGGMLLLARDATVTYCHSRTRDLPEIVGTADIVVAAVGRPEFVRGSWLKPGAVVIDAGYNPGNVGDVAFGEALEVASLLTPVPGGVGPMTIAVLLEQTVDAATRQANSS